MITTAARTGLCLALVGLVPLWVLSAIHSAIAGAAQSLVEDVNWFVSRWQDAETLAKREGDRYFDGRRR